jgi:hypothetical protein
MAIGSTYNNSGYSGYGGNPVGYNGTNNSGNRSRWESILSQMQGIGGSGASSASGSSGIGGTVGGIAGGALGTVIAPGIGTMIGGAVGTSAGDFLEGSLLGGGGEEDGADKLASQKAHSEGVTRKFEAKNSAPTAAIGNYMARALALQGMPVLGALNNLDFLAKISGYAGDYYPGIGKIVKKGFKGIGSLLRGGGR